MIKKCLTLLSVCVLCAMLSACVTGTADKRPTGSKIVVVDKNVVTDVELPANYSQKNYKRLTVAAFFTPTTKGQRRNDDLITTLGTDLETEISKLKRFTIVTRGHGFTGMLKEKDFQDLGVTSESKRMRFGRMLNAEFILNCTFDVARESHDLGYHKEWAYIVRLNYQLIDAETGEIIEADTTEGRANRKYYQSPDGRILTGYESNKSEKDGVKQASCRALAALGNRLGNKLPIGGQVTGMRGNRIQIDKGIAEGFMDKQVVTLYMNDYGIDTAFALAEVVPGDHKTVGKIYKWSEDADLESLIEEIQNDPSFVARNEVFAVSRGMPLPPEWEKQDGE